MSTERKPGSRGAKEPIGQNLAKQAAVFDSEPGTRRTPKDKGSTKTVSPRASYKKRKPRK